MAKALETPALTYQTWVLKVSIHCEGCKKKVKKVLQSIDGVYTTTVDPQKHKVTVTGNVEADTLIKKLLKNGKHAALWPEEQKNAPEKQQKKVDGVPDPTAKTDDETNSAEKEEKADEVNGGEESLENVEGDTKTDGSGSDLSAAADKKGQSVEPAAAKDQGGNGNKKKKKGKKNNINDKSSEKQGDGDATSEPAIIAPMKAPQIAPIDLSPPNHTMYPPYFPMHYPPMAYTASYNTAYPVSTASHYAPQPTSGGYILLHPRNYAPQPMLPERICIQNEDKHDYGIGCSIM